MRGKSLKIVPLFLALLLSKGAHAGVLQVDAESSRSCNATVITGGTPSISKETTSDEIVARLYDLGNHRAFALRSSSKIRAINLDYLICDSGERGTSDRTQQQAHLENDRFTAESLLYALFLRPVDPGDQLRHEYPLVSWRYVDSYYSFTGNYVGEYQQTIGGVPIDGATATIEYGNFGEITGFSASPVDIEIYLDLASAYQATEQIRGASRPAPPDLRIDGEREPEPEMSIYIGRDEDRPTAAWRYKSSDDAPSDEYYDVVIEAESGDVLRSSEEREETEYVIADGTARVNDEVLEFPVDCISNRRDCKLTAIKEIGDRSISVSVRTDVASAESTDFKSDTEEFIAEAESDSHAAVHTYAYIWKLVEELALEYLADVPTGEFPQEINIILTSPGSAPGALRRGTLYFGKIEGDPDVIHGGLDRHIIGHELVHLLLRSVRNPAIVTDECTGRTGEQFAAGAESLADALSILLETEILDNPRIPSSFGRKSLGDQYRNMQAPGKGTAFDSADIEQRIADGEALDSVFRDVNFSQPESLANMVHGECASDSTLKNLKYVNMGIPNSALYDLITVPRSERPGDLDDAQWRRLWIKTLLALVYDKQLQCDQRSCDNFCTIGFVIGSTANELHNRRMITVVSDVLEKHGVDVTQGECQISTN